MTTIAIFNLDIFKIFKLKRNNYYFAKEIEKEQKAMFLF
jgi:hypothetical protein